MATYIIGTNMSGYLPDGDPEIATSLAHAMAILKEAVLHTIEADEDQDDHSNDRYSLDWLDRMLVEIKRMLSKRNRACLYVKGYEHWIEKQ